MLVRINKYISDSGLASRRKCDDYINKGWVKINDRVAKNGDKVNTEIDKVFFKENEVVRDTEKIYIILNKPLNVITTNKDELGRKTTFDLLEPEDKFKNPTL
jgi:23S rRNA pseudouridine2605 synthase